LTTQFVTVEKAKIYFEQMVGWRRNLHANPELSFKEFETSKFVVDVLSKLPSMKVETGVGYSTAVIGTLTSGHGPTIAIRADMDALPILEDSNQPYASCNQGVMHACGHDAHTSILLGVAHVLSDSFQAKEIQGTVKFIFQPAEEATDENGLTGAPYMVRAGVLEGVDCIFALHMNPENPLGEIKINNGYSMANVDVFEAKIFGTGGHGAYPHLGKDPIFMLGPVLQAINGIVSRRVSPLEAGVVSIGQIHTGTASNIIPSEVFLQGTMRSYSPEVRELLISELEQAFSIVKCLGGDFEFNVTRGEPALNNNPELNQWLTQTIHDLFPQYKIIHQPFGLGGEDFAHMTEIVPGTMFFLGCAFQDNIQRDLHTPIFDIDENCLPVGVAIMAETAKRYLNGQYVLKSVPTDN
jgi:amidohydrolase